MPGRSRAEIVDAAVGLADAGGLDAVSMRSVAGALGMAPASLYRYLSSRDDLLDLMADAVVAELRPYPPPEPAGGWVEAVLALGRRQLDLHRRHPWLLDLVGRPSGVGPESLAFFEACRAALQPARASDRAKLEAIALMTLVVRGEQAPPVSPFGGRDLATYPNLAAALAGRPDAVPDEDLFGRALRSLLAGLLRAQEPAG